MQLPTQCLYLNVHRWRKSNTSQTVLPSLLPKPILSAAFLTAFDSNSILPVSQVRSLRSFLDPLSLTYYIQCIRKSFWLYLANIHSGPRWHVSLSPLWLPLLLFIPLPLPVPDSLTFFLDLKHASLSHTQLLHWLSPLSNMLFPQVFSKLTLPITSDLCSNVTGSTKTSMKSSITIATAVDPWATEVWTVWIHLNGDFFFSIVNTWSTIQLADWLSPRMWKPRSGGIVYLEVGLYKLWASLVAQLVKNPPAMQETPVRFLEKGKATHSSILAWRIPWTV